MMRLVAFFNGWRDCPHLWRTFITCPVRIRKIRAGNRLYHEIDLVGFVWFIRFGENKDE